MARTPKGHWVDQSLKLETIRRAMHVPTNAEFAEALGVSAPSVSNWVRATSGANTEKILDYLSQRFGSQVFQNVDIETCTVDELSRLIGGVEGPPEFMQRVFDAVSEFCGVGRSEDTYDGNYFLIERHSLSDAGEDSFDDRKDDPIEDARKSDNDGAVIRYLVLPVVFEPFTHYPTFRFRNMRYRIDYGAIFDFGALQFMMFLDRRRTRPPRCSMLSLPIGLPGNDQIVGGAAGKIVTSFSDRPDRIYKSNFILIKDFSSDGRSFDEHMKKHIYVREMSEDYSRIQRLYQNNCFSTKVQNRDALKDALTQLASGSLTFDFFNHHKK